MVEEEEWKTMMEVIKMMGVIEEELVEAKQNCEEMEKRNRKGSHSY